MRLFLLLLVSLNFLQASNGTDNSYSVVDLANQAEAAYANGDFQQAITLFQEIIGQGKAASEVYFNLGNAYYQTHDLGRALINYRRAEQVSPRDEDLRINLARVRAQRVDGPNFYVSVGDQIADWMSGWGSNSECEMGILIIWWLICGGLSAYALFPQWRKWLTWGLVIGCAIFAFVSGMEGIRLAVENTRPSAVIIDKDVSVMTGPDTSYMEIFALHEAAEVRIVEKRNGWVRIQLPDLQEGWVKGEALEAV